MSGCFNKINWDVLNSAIAMQLSNLILDMHHYRSDQNYSQTVFNSFIDRVTDTFSGVVPKLTLKSNGNHSQKGNKPKYNQPWLNSECLVAIHNKHYSYKLYTRNKCTVQFKVFKSYSTICQKVIKHAKLTYKNHVANHLSL